MRNLFRLLLSALVILSLSVQAVAFDAHPYHVSLTEIEWNPATGNFEVAVCLWPDDLEKALSVQEQKLIDLDASQNLDQMLSRYVEKTFSCHTDKKLRASVRWVGFESDNKQAWLYFELSPLKRADTGKTWTLRNSMLFELNSDQHNQINFLTENHREMGICSARNPEVVLRFEPKVPTPRRNSIELN